jgi:hypothetical protein
LGYQVGLVCSNQTNAKEFDRVSVKNQPIVVRHVLDNLIVTNYIIGLHQIIKWIESKIEFKSKNMIGNHRNWVNNVLSLCNVIQQQTKWLRSNK